ncbi:hypothetical protein [Aeromicrobium sp.]|uniref:hypothetical protein n=1 Tax=Aeromicrobium sp. TaxID=1871063 RepID=UPI003D6AEC9F
MTMKALLTVTALVLVAGCGSDAEPNAEKTVDKPADIPAREFPTEWAEAIDNPWLPLVPGASWTYEKKTADSVEDVVVTVTDKKKTVDGVETTVVTEKVTEDGELIDDTKTWYAQDAEGNVWNLGETTEAHEDGKVETEGWEAGVDGAEAGIAMLAEPKVGDVYRQMFLEGEAEDSAKVLSLDESIEGPVGSWEGVLQTEDTTPLEPEVEHKFYAKGVGAVEQHTVKGEEEQVVLTKYDKP